MKTVANQPFPHPNETNLRRKHSWGGKAKGNLQMVSSSIPAGAVGTQGWHRDSGLSHLAPSLLWELELLVLQDGVYEMGAIIYRMVERHHLGYLTGRKIFAAVSQHSWPSHCPHNI